MAMCESLKEDIPYHCIRVLLFTINILLDIAGFCILAVGLWTWLTREAGVFPPSADVIRGIPEIIIIYGAIIASIALFGSMGIGKQSQYALLVHMVLLLLLCASELVLGTITYLKIQPLTTALRDDMTKGMGEYNSRIDIEEAWDNLQRMVECCGVTSPTDWSNINFNTTQQTFKCSSSKSPVPMSCKIQNSNSNDCYQTGCYTVGYNYVTKNIVPVGVVLMSIFMLQLLALLMAVILYGLKKLRHTSEEAHTLLTHRSANEDLTRDFSKTTFN